MPLECLPVSLCHLDYLDVKRKARKKSLRDKRVEKKKGKWKSKRKNKRLVSGTKGFDAENRPPNLFQVT